MIDTSPEALARLRQDLQDYARRWPEEDDVRLFLELLDDAQDPFERARLGGHFTASCWLVDRSRCCGSGSSSCSWGGVRPAA